MISISKISADDYLRERYQLVWGPSSGQTTYQRETARRIALEEFDKKHRSVRWFIKIKDVSSYTIECDALTSGFLWDTATPIKVHLAHDQRDLLITLNPGDRYFVTGNLSADDVASTDDDGHTSHHIQLALHESRIEKG